VGTGVAEGQSPVRRSFEAVVLQAPALVAMDGRPHLVYELHLTNFARGDLTLTAIELYDPASSDGPVAEFRGDALASILGGPGVGAVGDRRRVESGHRVAAHFWIPLDPSQAHRRLTHRIEFREGDLERSLTAAAVTVQDQPPVALGPPVSGGVWVAMYDPVLGRGHQRVLLALDGSVRVPARFAIDWFRVDEMGRVADGDGQRVDEWHGYGADVLAVADATVVRTRDSIDESPTLTDEFVPDLDLGGGNYVSLDLGNGRYVHYEHLRPGSIRVRAGDRVQEGDVVAQAGYTGHSTGPHVHMHVSNGPAPLAGEGVPWLFREWEMLGSYTSLASSAALIDGVAWTPVSAGMPIRRTNEMPGRFAVVNFGAPQR
jgi:hypothetical protein